MDSATLAAMQSSGGGGEGNWFCGAVNIEGGGLEGLLNIGAISGEDNWAKWLPCLEAAFYNSYKGGVLWRFLEKLFGQLKNDKWLDTLDAMGVGGGESMSEGASAAPSAGGEAQVSGISYDL